MKYILIIIWLSMSGEEIHQENFVDYPTLEACQVHKDDALDRKGKEFYPFMAEEIYILKDAYCKEKEREE